VQWQTKILGLILKKANELINVIEEEDPNGKKSSEVCRDVQKESVWYSFDLLRRQLHSNLSWTNSSPNLKPITALSRTSLYSADS
jgi:hypothetical protein